jgi:hypothetical protein
MKKKEEKKRILGRRLAKDFTEKELKQVAGGSLSRCGDKEYDDSDPVF